MNLVKTTLLGSAAALVGSLGAQAADLPVRKAAPVDYVRVCDWTGVGFFYIPGTDTCIQVGGRAYLEGAFVNATRSYYPAPLQGAGALNGRTNTPIVLVPAGTTVIGRNQDQSGFRAQGRLAVDARTQTAYGTLRSFVRYNFTRVEGVFTGGTAGGVNSYANQAGNTTSLDKGFVQFAGITAGRLQSFFDFYADTYNLEGIANSDQNINLIAYTYKAGGGLSGTLSLESHEGRIDGIGTIVGGAFEVGGVNQGANALTAKYGGSGIPDIVGQINYTQAWGQAQLSGAYHQVNVVAGPFNGTGGQGYNHNDSDGFAVQGGVQIKLPMLAAGDDVWIQGAYQNGAYLYQDSASNMSSGFNSRLLGGFQHLDVDAIAIGRPGSPNGGFTVAQSRGFSVMAAFSHFFTATFQDILFGSYEETGYGPARLIDWTQGGIGNASQYKIGNQFVFTPVKNLGFYLEFDYAHLDQTLAHNQGQVATRLPVGITQNPDAFEARLRVERDF